MDGRPAVIEVLRLASGKLLLCVGVHCVESDADDKSLDAAIKTLAEMSGVDRIRINVMVARATMTDA
jgi:hypothetical protein